MEYKHVFRPVWEDKSILESPSYYQCECGLIQLCFDWEKGDE